MDDSKKKTIMVVVIVAALVIAGVITFATRSTISSDIPSEFEDQTVWMKCTNPDCQTIYEVILTARTPDWGQTLKGDVALVAKYGNVEEMVTIPYELQSRSLAGCVSDLLWLGPVEKGQTVSRMITLYRKPNRKIKIHAVSIPSEIQIKVPENGLKSDQIHLECVFSSNESGLQQGTAQLALQDNEGNEQPLRLEYCAFVWP